MKKPTIAVSVGDLNGVGIEIALKAHLEVSKLCNPIYCINAHMLEKAAKLLGVAVPNDFSLVHPKSTSSLSLTAHPKSTSSLSLTAHPKSTSSLSLTAHPKSTSSLSLTASVNGEFEIKAGQVDAASGKYSYDSFTHAIKLCEKKEADAVVTMPIHKEAWKKAGLHFVGHTDLLRDYFKQDAIMMLGCEKMFVALYTEHVPLKDVPCMIQKEKITLFLLDLHKSIGDKKVAVLGLNPHAGDNGVLGNEEREIEAAIKKANETIGKELFYGAIVPDIAFTPHFRSNFNYFVAMYHDQGLAPLKALYFDESVNISLNLPIIRTSVDHGTAFDIAYKGEAKTLSYMNAVKSAIGFIK